MGGQSRRTKKKACVRHVEQKGKRKMQVSPENQCTIKKGEILKRGSYQWHGVGHVTYLVRGGELLSVTRLQSKEKTRQLM